MYAHEHEKRKISRKSWITSSLNVIGPWAVRIWRCEIGLVSEGYARLAGPNHAVSEKEW